MALSRSFWQRLRPEGTPPVIVGRHPRRDRMVPLAPTMRTSKICKIRAFTPNERYMSHYFGYFGGPGRMEVQEGYSINSVWFPSFLSFGVGPEDRHVPTVRLRLEP